MSILGANVPLHFYIVTEVHDPSMESQIHVGQRIIDSWMGKSHTYTLVNMVDGSPPRAGWSVVHERKIGKDEAELMRDPNPEDES